jgi:hypothetical protein
MRQTLKNVFGVKHFLEKELPKKYFIMKIILLRNKRSINIFFSYSKQYIHTTNFIFFHILFQIHIK